MCKVQPKCVWLWKVSSVALPQSDVAKKPLSDAGRVRHSALGVDPGTPDDDKCGLSVAKAALLSGSFINIPGDLKQPLNIHSSSTHQFMAPKELNKSLHALHRALKTHLNVCNGETLWVRLFLGSETDNPGAPGQERPGQVQLDFWPDLSGEGQRSQPTDGHFLREERRLESPRICNTLYGHLACRV